MAFHIRQMTRGELDRVIDWAAAEGWNPGLDDGEAFYAADPEGFLLGTLDREPVASISVVAYGERFGFLGFYICRPEYRGQGYGFALWQAGLARLGARTIGLDGVLAEQANYRKQGFVLAHRNVRFGGKAAASETADPRIVELRGSRPTGLAGSIAAYDRAFFPAPRERFIRAWIAPPGRRTLAFVEGDAIRGYGSVRACREGYKIGPLFADDATTADRLFAALTGRLRGSPVYLDVPEPNAAGVALAERHGMTPVFETARMYRGKAPALPLGRTFGITTFELG
jgi:GNAT superfamily N-acetyltransferase